MQTATKEGKKTLTQIIDDLRSFTLSDKLKFAIKASLSMALAYLIPMSLGWAQAGTAAITVMLIAAMGSVGDSVMKGALRVIGTVIGAALGMALIGLFPQDRTFYLIMVSILVTILLYFARAYKGDMTVFLLSAITLMGMFKNGEIDDVFIYGIDKTFMTIVGIGIYTFIGVFLWPVNVKDTSVDNAASLSEMQKKLYAQRDAENDVRKPLYTELIGQEQLLGTSIIGSDSSSDVMNFSSPQWYDIVGSYKKVNELLTLLSYHDKTSYADEITKYISNYEALDSEITALLEALPLAWKEQKEITLPETFNLAYNSEKIEELSQLDRASLTTTISDMIGLHEELSKLAEKLNALISPMPTLFTLEDTPAPSSFLWFDMEHLKGSLLTFIIFWTSVLLWIFVNPPGGFMIVMMATGLSVLTTFSPVKPSILIIVFSFAFVFAAAMYVMVLPNLHYGWELGLFMFTYSFIGFYFINPKISVFFLLGTATLGINNTMNYNFDVFLITLFIFYAFLFTLLFFYYIPFSTKPERLFLVMKQRFFKLSQDLMQRNRNLDENKATLLGGIAANYSTLHLMSTVKKMQLWASQIDEKYFDDIDKKTLLGFSKECETFTYLLEMMYRRDGQLADNALIKVFRTKNNQNTLADLLGEYAKGKEVKEIDNIWKDEKQMVSRIEEALRSFISNVKPGQYSDKEIIEFYENISLRRNVWISFFSCQTMMEALDFKVLERSRF
ncbi:MAG: hypothetical protein GQ531_01020 [Sulfurovum sp.]|nr:hypothetical protein [Sulfurovum sp.]